LDSSVSLAHAAAQAAGIALLPVVLFSDGMWRTQLVCPYDTQVYLGSYWLTSLKSKRVSPAMQAFRDWLLAESKAGRRGSSIDALESQKAYRPDADRSPVLTLIRRCGKAAISAKTTTGHAAGAPMA
jgi:hypothetical protein